VSPRVTLLTDFGTRDGYLGAMKGALAAAVPGILMDDVSHDLPAGDVTSALYALGRYWRLYPEGTVHLVVVDPGVGSARRALACELDGRFLVAPDNGVASRALDQASSWRAVEILAASLPGGGSASATFHGRDVFAPAAAHLALGRPLARLGRPLQDPLRLAEPIPERELGVARGMVVLVDRFGNLLTNLPGAWLDDASRARIAERSVPVVRTYSDVEPGALAALVGSDGRVEIAARDASAAELTGLGRGAGVLLLP